MHPYFPFQTTDGSSEGPSRRRNLLPPVHVAGQQPRIVDIGPIVGNPCSFCDRIFPTFQTLAGHMTSYHRSELEALRRQHEPMAGNRQVRIAPPADPDEVTSAPPPLENHQATSGIIMEPLTPNYTFWEMHRRADQPPPFYNFVEIRRPEPEAVVMQAPPPPPPQQQQPLLGHDEPEQVDDNSEDTITDPMAMVHLQGAGEVQQEVDDADSMTL